MMKIIKPLSVSLPGKESEELFLETAKEGKDKKVLEMGIGTGLVSIRLAKLGFKVDGVDIDPYAVKTARLNAKNNDVNVNFFVSDLFKDVGKKYDIIIFNPPTNVTKSKIKKYLGNIIRRVYFIERIFMFFYNKEINIKRANLIKNFLIEGKNHLNKNGKIIMIVYENEIKELKDILNNNTIKALKHENWCILKIKYKKQIQMRS